MTLAGLNTYSGATTINAGTLSVDADNKLGTDASTHAITLSGGTLQITGGSAFSTTKDLFLTTATTSSLDVTNSAGATLTTLNGTGNLVKTGTGTLTLAGNNNAATWTGTTTINAGTVVLTNANGLASTFDTSGAGTLSFGSLTGSVFLGGLVGTGNLAIPSGVTLHAGAAASSAPPFAGSLTGAGALRVRGNSNGNQIARYTGTSSIDGNLDVATGSTLLLDGGSFTTTANWGNGGDGGVQVTNGGHFTVTASMFVSPHAVTQDSGTVSLGTNSSNNLALLTFTTTGGTATINGKLLQGININASGTAVVTLGGSQFLTGTGPSQAGVLSLGGAAAVTFTSALDLANNATFAGTINLNGGTLTLPGLTKTNTASVSTVNFNGGTLKLAGAATLASTVNTTFAVLGGGAVIDTQAFAVTIAQPFTSGSGTDGGLTKLGSGSLTLSGANTYTGGTTINAGTLDFGAANALFSTGAVTLSGGTLSLGSLQQTVGAVSLQSGSITGTSGVLTATAFDASSGTISAILAGSGAVLTKTTSGTVTLSGANTYSGGTALAAGTLAFTTGGLGTSGAVTFTGDSTLRYGAATTTDLSARLILANGVTGTIDTNGNNLTYATGFGAASTGGFAKTGSGTLSLTGANTYSGATTVNAGTLSLNAAGTALTQTSGVVIASGATVALGAANQINATAALTLNGGTLALHGFNQTLGALDLNAASALDLSGSAALVFANSAALDWNSAPLSIVNFSLTTNALRFGTTSGGLTATQLGLIQFYEFGNSAARIDANGFLAPSSVNFSNTGSADTVLTSTITGTTTVAQSGTGTTTLTGANISTGTATVSQGTLVIGTAAGGNWAGNVTVSGSGTLKGRGTITGAVLIATGGTYSPGNSPAIQHVGSLTVDSDSLVIIELDGATAGNGSGFHDQVISAGTVTLNGGTLVAQTSFTGASGYTPVFGSSHTIITGSVLTGSFTAYDFTANSAGLTWMPEYTASAVNLFAVPTNYATLAGLTTNQAHLGAALQSLRPTVIDSRATRSSTGTLFNGLMRQDAAGLRTAYDQLTPEKLTALSAATFQSASILNSSLQQRSAELRRAGPASVSLNGVAVPAAADDCTLETVIEDGVHYQIAKAKPKRRYGYFATATGAFAEVDGAADRLGSFSQTGAATCGVDYALNENQSVGLVVGQYFADTDFAASSGSARTTTNRVGVFHDYHNAGFFVNTSVSAGFSSYDVRRKVAFLSETAAGETRGTSFGGQVATGYDFKVGDYLLGPKASLAYDHARINGFTETGSAADLTVNRQSSDSLTTAIGFHVSRPFEWQHIGWIPDVSFSVNRQHFNPNAITARFTAGGDAFKVKPQAGGGESINPGASLTALLASGWSVRLSYDAILNPQSAEHRVNLSLNAGF